MMIIENSQRKPKYNSIEYCVHFRRLRMEVSVGIRINVGHSFAVWFLVRLILFLLSICRCICLVKIDFHRSSPTSIWISPNLFHRCVSIVAVGAFSSPSVSHCSLCCCCCSLVFISTSFPPRLRIYGTYLFGMQTDRFFSLHLLFHFHFDDCFTQIVDNAWGASVSLT